MKQLISLFVFSLFAIFAQAQKKAVTENGVEVILNDDGTWKYADGEDSVTDKTIVNPNNFSKSIKSTFSLKSKKNNFEYWLDPKKWSFKKPEENEAAEYSLQLKEGDLYGMIISEKIEIPLETLRSVAIKNAKTVATDLRVAKEEFRMVNQHKVLLLQLDGTMHGIKISYYGYYFSDASGTTQFVTYTAQNLLEKYRNVCEELLNGFTVVN